LKLLAVDTSTEACSAALYVDGEINQHYEIAPRQHSRLILNMIDELMSEADIAPKNIDVLAFGRGPGSFMGVRIAAGIVQGISFAHSIPVVPVSTLAAIASIAIEKTGINNALALIDARMQEVYCGIYKKTDSDLILQGKESVISPDNVALPDTDSWVAAGSGWTAYADVFNKKIDNGFVTSVDDCFPSAAAIARLAVRDYEKGIAVTAAETVPVYLRDDVAKKPRANI
jgi:tRNA threonylcarbamoyladenosine biosynthesis protein TsaB